jgi:hypothetical protein
MVALPAVITSGAEFTVWISIPEVLAAKLELPP